MGGRCSNGYGGIDAKSHEHCERLTDGEREGTELEEVNASDTRG